MGQQRRRNRRFGSGLRFVRCAGPVLETVDFNNPTSADGACGYGGDEVGADEGRSDEELFIDTRKINDKCHSVASGCFPVCWKLRQFDAR